MELCIFVEPQQGTTYHKVMALAQAVEGLGFDGFFTSDHYMKMGEVDGLPGPLDAWSTLAGLARDTSRVRLGTLVTPVTFRRPGPTAVLVAQVDDMSDGRIELGMGAGWYEAEHSAYGIPFLTTADRFDLLEESLEVITGMWATDADASFGYDGTHVQLTDSPGLPKPTQDRRVPIIIGGSGKIKTPRLAARFADEFNKGFTDVEGFVAQCDVVREACAAQGRDPKTMKFSTALVTCCGATDAELDRRAAKVGREPAEIAKIGVYGSPAEVAAQLRAFGDAGADRVYLQLWDIEDLEHVELLAAEVVPSLSA